MAANAASAPAPSDRQANQKARCIGKAELQRDMEDTKAALRVTKRGIAAGLAEMKKHK